MIDNNRKYFDWCFNSRFFTLMIQHRLGRLECFKKSHNWKGTFGIFLRFRNDFSYLLVKMLHMSLEVRCKITEYTLSEQSSKFVMFVTLKRPTHIEFDVRNSSFETKLVDIWKLTIDYFPYVVYKNEILSKPQIFCLIFIFFIWKGILI